MEADFQREYRIDLGAEIGAMTWRRFTVLIGGLSAQSRTALALRGHGKGGARPRPVLDKAAASAHFATIR